MPSHGPHTPRLQSPEAESCFQTQVRKPARQPALAGLEANVFQRLEDISVEDIVAFQAGPLLRADAFGLPKNQRAEECTHEGPQHDGSSFAQENARYTVNEDPEMKTSPNR